MCDGALPPAVVWTHLFQRKSGMTWPFIYLSAAVDHSIIPRCTSVSSSQSHQPSRSRLSVMSGQRTCQCHWRQSLARGGCRHQADRMGGHKRWTPWPVLTLSAASKISHSLRGTASTRCYLGRQLSVTGPQTHLRPSRYLLYSSACRGDDSSLASQIPVSAADSSRIMSALMSEIGGGGGDLIRWAAFIARRPLLDFCGDIINGNRMCRCEQMSNVSHPTDIRSDKTDLSAITERSRRDLDARMSPVNIKQWLESCPANTATIVILDSFPHISCYKISCHNLHIRSHTWYLTQTFQCSLCKITITRWLITRLLPYCDCIKCERRGRPYSFVQIQWNEMNIYLLVMHQGLSCT